MKQSKNGKPKSASSSKVSASSRPSKGKSDNKNETASAKNTQTSNDKRVKAKAQPQPPFPLYNDGSEASVAEGLESVINLLKGRKNIVVLAGAGISVSCGIPDFRSKGSGLYSTLDTEVGPFSADVNAKTQSIFNCYLKGTYH